MNYFNAGVGLLVYSLIVLALMVATLIISFKKTKKSILKRNFIFIFLSFLSIYSLFLIGRYYQREPLGPFNFFGLINESMELVKFKVNSERISALCGAYPIYYAVFTLSFITFEVATILSVVGLFGLKIFNFFILCSLFNKRADLVIGTSENAIQYLKNTKNSILLGDGV